VEGRRSKHYDTTEVKRPIRRGVRGGGNWDCEEKDNGVKGTQDDSKEKTLLMSDKANGCGGEGQ